MNYVEGFRTIGISSLEQKTLGILVCSFSQGLEIGLPGYTTFLYLGDGFFFLAALGNVDEKAADSDPWYSGSKDALSTTRKLHLLMSIGELVKRDF